MGGNSENMDWWLIHSWDELKHIYIKYCQLSDHSMSCLVRCFRCMLQWIRLWCAALSAWYRNWRGLQSKLLKAIFKQSRTSTWPRIWQSWIWRTRNARSSTRKCEKNSALDKSCCPSIYHWSHWSTWNWEMLCLHLFFGPLLGLKSGVTQMVSQRKRTTGMCLPSRLLGKQLTMPISRSMFDFAPWQMKVTTRQHSAWQRLDVQFLHIGTASASWQEKNACA